VNRDRTPTPYPSPQGGGRFWAGANVLFHAVVETAEIME